MSPAEAIGSLFGGGTESGRRIIFSIRLPRTLAAMLLGGALSVSGLLLQSFFSNPIAGPFVLGISSGAKLTVAAAMIFALEHGAALGSLPMTAAALAGALGAVGVIMLMSGRVRSMAQLIVAGVMVGYICSALTELMVTFADDANIVDLHSWSMGSFSGISMRDVGFIAAAAVPAFIGAFMLSKPMSAYRLGESYARSAGVDIRAFRTALVILSSILSACVTAFAGPVSFVGVAVPHLMKALFGTSKPIVIIPASLIGGGVFCMGCDLAARLMFAPVELSVSTVTAVLGAPVVIGVMLERRGRKNDGQ
ncbi:MAG: iron ABC transporter permease [Ruminococcus sp.]|nr:iron ABC transporter permease [Ruminococcus sp.]